MTLPGFEPMKSAQSETAQTNWALVAVGNSIILILLSFKTQTHSAALFLDEDYFIDMMFTLIIVHGCFYSWYDKFWFNVLSLYIYATQSS